MRTLFRVKARWPETGMEGLQNFSFFPIFQNLRRQLFRLHFKIVLRKFLLKERDIDTLLVFDINMHSSHSSSNSSREDNMMCGPEIQSQECKTGRILYIGQYTQGKRKNSSITLKN